MTRISSPSQEITTLERMTWSSTGTLRSAQDVLQLFKANEHKDNSRECRLRMEEEMRDHPEGSSRRRKDLPRR